MAALVLLSACQAGNAQVLPAPTVQTGVTPPSAPASAQASASAKAPASAQAFTAKLSLTPSHAAVGQTVRVAGSGYPAGANIELVYYSAKGRYELEGGTEFVGQRYQATSKVLTGVKADANGEIATSLVIPQDFGGNHDIRGRVDNREISQAGIFVEPTFSLSPKEGPIGTPIELKVVGVDSDVNSNTWHVLYDNRYLGFVSAVTTGGVAVARFRAAGPVGDRAISIWHNSWNSTPYLNFQQGPYKETPVAGFSFKVTGDPGPWAPQIDDFKATDNPLPGDTKGPGKLSLTVDRGTVGTPTVLQGSALPANASLTLKWVTMVGNRVSNSGFSEQTRDLEPITTSANGTFQKSLTIPDDLGGYHRLEVASGDKMLGSTGMVIEPSVVSIDPVKVHTGDTVNVHLKGLGWTTYDNTYTVTYDDSYIGYSCGFSTAGDVQFKITATGQPGTHIIDLYPTIYKGKDAKPRVYSVPQLTYADDHPQRKTPAIHLSIQIVE
ncbi:MAG: hypothetical protein KGJ86_01605 [Chloroflexota bacterium]|nr:hypothetical protein [Chloroflexota bacterium]